MIRSPILSGSLTVILRDVKFAAFLEEIFLLQIPFALPLSPEHVHGLRAFQ